MAEVHTYTVTEMNRLIKNLVEGSGLVANVPVAKSAISNATPPGTAIFP